jgi:acyl carrier protein
MNKLVDLVTEVLATDSSALADDVAFSDLESWDSMRHMSLVFAIEESYGIRVTQDEIVRMASLGGIRAVLQDRGLG